MEGGKTALYLHTFINGKRQRKSLELTLYTNPENTEQRRENKMTLELAERMRAQALITLQDKKAFLGSLARIECCVNIGKVNASGTSQNNLVLSVKNDSKTRIFKDIHE